MTKSEKEDQERQHSQGAARKTQASRHRKKHKNRQITQYFSKVERARPSNPHLPTTDKALVEQISQQNLELQEREKVLMERQEELILKLQNQKDEHDRKMSRLRAVMVQQLKIGAQIQRTLQKQRQPHLKSLQLTLKNLQQSLEKKAQTLSNIDSSDFQSYFLQKQVKYEQQKLKRIQIELTIQKERERLRHEEEHCYLAKEGWPLLSKRYQCLKLIGKGGFSEVYQAYDLDCHQSVAVKLSQVQHLLAGRTNKSQYLKHIKREYQVHKRLSHPNIVPLLEVLEVDNAICIVLQFCSGPTLAHLLTRSTCLPQQEAKIVIKQLLSVINYLSTQRIVHYDLKPQNIIFQNGILKVLDFGICKIIDNQYSKMALTSQGVGTYCYLPPETFSANNPVLSNKVDIWSLGVIFYEMLYGCRPSTHQLTSKEDLSFPSTRKVSACAKEFICSCLQTCLGQRLDPFSAQSHIYFQQP